MFCLNLGRRVWYSTNLTVSVTESAAVLSALGFIGAGVVAWRSAAWLMSLYGGNVAARSTFATAQSLVATGASWKGAAAFAGSVTDVCEHLCD